jgi:hypothetical protein
LEDDLDDDEDLEDEPDDFEPDLDEELRLPDTEDPLEEDEDLLCDIVALLPEDVLDGALITLPELDRLDDEAAGLLTGAEDDLLTCDLEGALV